MPGRRRRSARWALALLALVALALGGCGSPAPNRDTGSTLTIYSDLPSSGPQRDVMRSIELGEELALRDWNYQVGRREIVFQPEPDGGRGGWDPPDTSSAATQATQDPSAIAYIGDFDSAATATSLPITNQGNLLQVSPASDYIGLTDQSAYDDKGEPASYYNGVKSFARLVPTDVQEARATVQFMRALGVKRLFAITDTAPYASYDSVIATMVADDAQHAGITLAGTAQINSAASSPASGYASLAQTVTASNADAVIVGAAPDSGVVSLWEELFEQVAAIKLFAPSTLATNPFLNAIGGAATQTYVTSPLLPLRQYGAGAQRVLRKYKSVWGTGATSAWSLYGFVAMTSVLKAILAAEAEGKGGSRLAVTRAFFHLGYRHSVIGGYTINSRGDTSRARFVGYAVVPNGGSFRLVEKRRNLQGGP